MGSVEKDWFDARRLFDEGYPEEITSALRALPTIRQAVRDEVLGFGAETILEIGPGDASVVDGLPGAFFLDITPGFLHPLRGARVLGDLMHAPFLPGSFDLVVVSDVLTHIRPAERRLAIARVAALARDILVFNPELATQRVEGSTVPTRIVTAYLEENGYRVADRKFISVTPSGEYPMRIVTGRRG